MTKVARYSTRDLKNLWILPENSAKCLGSRRECCCGYISIYENSPKKLQHLPSLSPEVCRSFFLMAQGRMQLEHSSHVVKVGGKITCQDFKSWHILKETTEPADPLELYHRNLDILENVLKWIVLSNQIRGSAHQRKS